MEMFESLKECDIEPSLISEGYSQICKMSYSKIDSKDIWIGYELGGTTLSKLTFDVKGGFDNGMRI